MVTIASRGLAGSVVAELERALDDHELIKIKIVADDREQRKKLIDEVIKETNACRIQNTGNVLLVYRPAKEPDPVLSNLQRYDHIL